jgi:hypothetical protein
MAGFENPGEAVVLFERFITRGSTVPASVSAHEAMLIGLSNFLLIGMRLERRLSASAMNRIFGLLTQWGCGCRSRPARGCST